MFKSIATHALLIMVLFSIHGAQSVQLAELNQNSSESIPSEKNLTTHKILNTLVENVNFLKDHEEDYLELFPDYISQENMITIKNNIIAYDKVLGFLKQLKYKEIDIHNVIMETLILRMSLIKSRQHNTEIFQCLVMEGRADEQVYGPTDPAVFDSLTDEQQISVQKATAHYQMYNRVIIGLLSCVDSHALPPKIIETLRANPTLCSIIMSKTRNLGHPDQTFDLSGKGMSDWEYYITHICASETIPITVYSTFNKGEKTVSVTPYLRKLYEPGWKHPYAENDLPYPDFLKPISALEANQRRKDLSSSISASTTKAVKTKSKNMKKKRLEKENKVESLISQQKESTNEAISSQEQNRGGELAESSSSPDLTASETEKTERHKQILRTEDQSQHSQQVETLLAQSMVFSPTDEEMLISENTVETTVEEEKMPLIQEILPSTSPKFDYLPPRGMRLLHSQQQITPSQTVLKVLKGKKLKRLEQIFSSKFSSINYKKVASLWRYINGDNSINASGGTSHKELLDNQGHVIMGIFAHNDNTQYGSRTIKYIRDAFTRIGYGYGSIYIG